ncbi:hypothetical protein MJO28_003768 [Puccinia striiformis f. sp. tritici]|uniref:Uncharacterized protein n=3 Tax=Puccinia striiformis TaxID=27350 RepID=A0A0L0UUX4_9BASI|nr:hypothetical protein Pst134EA_007618 [Puccinia striiformis f. sp. tritici]KAI9624931.1 hypothetical protein KEM48_008653 [Puccinia striiformis f. sp. tritici PST-130]KNE90847.1 hypothetical protein PSTG_15715 [Puccinia striiformis f. sp. tritici PST-78]POW10789.1 hypothetical protein PSTT_05761 [Puccinia striiformis]KAH9460552.1 hypothetical protein Pst134EB_008723 [Puccinia striiformis f. sp. tritici]KAH9470353.1 hypothetical protein Pst134EA_007618 [Puccinia striiformis f. sp. tritici]
MQVLVALAIAVVLYSEMAIAMNVIVCTASEQSLCGKPRAKGPPKMFRKSLTVKIGTMTGTNYCPDTDVPYCCPQGTIRFTSSNEKKYAKFADVTHTHCRAYKNRHGVQPVWFGDQQN